MKGVFMRKLTGIILIVIFIITACGKKQKIEKLGDIEIHRKVKFSQKMIPMSLLKIGKNYVAYDGYNDQIALFDKSGNIFFTYKKYGKGPGEYVKEEDLFLLGEVNNKLYVLAYAQNKVLIFDIINNSKLEFIDELRIDSGNVIVGGISPEKKMILNVINNEYLFHLYSLDGDYEMGLIKRKQIDLEQLSAEEMKKYLVKNIFIPTFKGRNMILIGAFNKHIKFYVKNDNDNRYKLIKDVIIHQYKEKSYNSETNQNKNDRRVVLSNIGLAGQGILENNYYLAISPENEAVSYINKYKFDGTLIGAYEIENKTTERINNLFIFNKDEILYTKQLRNNKNEEYKQELDYFYISKITG